MSADASWRQYLEAGEHLAVHEPELFPTVAMLVSALAWPGDADVSALRSLVQGAFGDLPRGDSARAGLSASQIADALVIAEPSLADVPDLDAVVARFSADERAAAMQWAREHSAACIAGAEEHPGVPMCISALYARLSPANNTQEGI